MFFVFEYILPRPLDKFWEIEGTELSKKQVFCQNLILECAASPLPASLLYLILRQGQVHSKPDGGIYFLMDLDLTELKTRKESDCVIACVSLLLTYLNRDGKKPEKDIFCLLEKKMVRNSCLSFRELYTDIQLLETFSGTKKRYTSQSKEQRKEQLFQVLCFASMILLILVLIIFISQIVWGENLLFRLFGPCFEKIGTESLLQ